MMTTMMMMTMMMMMMMPTHCKEATQLPLCDQFPLRCILWKCASTDRRRGSDVRAHQIVPRVRRWPSRSAVDTQPSRQYAFVRLWSVVVRQIRRFHGIGRHLHRQWAEDAAAFDHQARRNRIYGHAGHSFKDASLPNFVSRVEHDGYQTLFG